nr:hypothetical protein [uncultured Methanolobus sp.]
MKTSDDIDFFKTTSAQMNEMYKEFSELSKKKADNPINLFKLEFINKIINDANSILGEAYKPFDHFDNFKEEQLPTNSDVIIVLSQYQNALEKLRCNNIEEDYNGWYWLIEGEISSIKTTPPSPKFKR